MTEREFRDLAALFGYSRLEFCDVMPFDKWQTSLADAHKSAQRLRNDVLAEAPWAKRLCVAAYPYDFFAPYTGGQLSAYYREYNRENAMLERFVQALNASGVHAQAKLNIPSKAAAQRAGLAAYGRNGLVQAPGLGSHIILALIALDQEFEISATPIEPFSQCGACHKCELACPTGAIKDGVLDASKCLRGLMMQGGVVPGQYRAAMGEMLLGCEQCMRACPHNANAIKNAVPAPLELLKLTDVERVLNPQTRDGYIDEYGTLLGHNYAIPNRVMAQALLVAANGGRRDLLALIDGLRVHPSDAIREHAAWAAKQLET